MYYNVGWGGGRRWLYECVSRLAEYHDIELFCIDRDSIGPQYPDVGELGLPLYAVPIRDIRRPRGVVGRLLEPALKLVDLVRFDLASKMLAARIDAGGYDLLLASVGGYTEAPLVLRHAATPGVYYCHEPMRSVYEPSVDRPYYRRSPRSLARGVWHSIFYGGLIRIWDRQGTRRATQVIANSRYTADFAQRAYGVRCSVNYPGVDTEQFRPSAAPRERFVLSVGELISSKGFDDAVTAIGTIAAEQRPKLVLVCNRTYAPERAYVEAIARRQGVALEIRERVPDDEVKRLYHTASVLLYTPNREPFGLTPIEAMASGTPVVAVREAGPAETVVDGETGFLRERDPQALGAAVLRLLDDEVLRTRMSRAAREHAVAFWTWDRSVSELAGMLSEVAERTSASRDGLRDGDRPGVGGSEARNTA